MHAPPANGGVPTVASAGVNEAEVVADLHDPAMRYEDIARKHQTSRGTIYNIALKHGARKHEARIRERAAEAKARRREFLREVLNATQRADVLDFLDGIPDEAVQLHVCSPPYNIGKAYGDAQLIDRQRFHYYLGWLLQVLSEMVRTTRQGGVIFLQVGSTLTDDGQRYPLDCLLFEHLRGMGLTFQNRVVWKQPHGLTPRKRLAERYETALVFSKGAPSVFNAAPARTPQKEPDKRAFKGPHKGKLSGHPLGAWPTDVWEIRSVGAKNKERTGHPAQFPEELARRAVMLYTMPTDLVCDAFVGSGTTAAVATRTGRHFIGADLFYEDLRIERLSKVEPDLVSHLPGVTRESVAIWQAEARPVKRPATLTAFLMERAATQ